MKHLRKLYEQFGVDKYYQEYGDYYNNPHLPQIEELLQQNIETINSAAILDFCAGGGEVTAVLQSLGVTQITASDPFTAALYQKQIEQPCLDWSFDAVIKGKMTGKYSTVICCFAMHLCPPTQLYPLASQIFQHTTDLIIITPHKRPALEKLDGVLLYRTDFVLTPKGKKVFWKHYRAGY